MCADGWDKKFGLYGWDHRDPENKRVLHDTSKVQGATSVMCVPTDHRPQLKPS